MNRTVVTVLLLLAAAAAAVVWLQREREADYVYSLPAGESPHEYLKGIYAADQATQPSPYHIRAAVVPHHVVSTEAMAAGVKVLVPNDPQRILLLSPDHFEGCPTPLCTTSGTFETLLGNVQGEPLRLNLGTASLVTAAPDLFKKEHGIRAVLPYIAHYLPGTTVVPIVFSQKHPWESADEEAILKLFAEALDDETDLVISSDFSHYLTISEADKKDEETAQTIFAKDLDGLKALDNPAQSDCPRCLWLLASLAEAQDFYNPSVLLHTNSARLLNDTTVPETTSHFALVFYANEALGPEDIALAGDVTLTRTKQVPVLSGDIQKFWAGEGLRVVNLEGPLSPSCMSAPNPFIFCNPQDLWSDIRDFATHWGVQNNHMLDKGKAGYAETKALIEEAGEGAISTSPYQDSKYFIVALTRVTNPVPQQAAVNLREEYERAIEDLRNADPNLLRIAYIHAGVEYQTLTSKEEKEFYQSFIDAGADAVLVSHSHVMGDMFIYKNRPIFTGLGNFIFDQTDAVPTSTAKLVRLRKEGGKVLFETLISR